MKLDLALVGQGAVTPAGIGAAAFAREPQAEAVPFVGQPEKQWPAFRVDPQAPALARWRSEPRLRRASPISFFLVEAAEQCLAGLSAEERRATGLVVAFSTGSLVYSRRFYAAVAREGRGAASPALFPETVFNSPVSHVATALGLGGAAYALVGDETAWIAALKTAWLWLREKEVTRVVVLGAEEFDPIVLDAYRAAGWLRRGSRFVPSEGAGGVLVRAAEAGDVKVLTEGEDGFPYRSRREAEEAARRALAGIDPAHGVLPSARRNWLAPVEAVATASRIAADPGPYLGEAFAASAAWATLRALSQLDTHPQILQPVWGLNHQVGTLQFAKRRSS
jgi:hypothetical protein